MRKTITFVKASVFSLALGIVSFSPIQAQNRENTAISVKDLPKITTSSIMGGFNANFSDYHITSDFLAANLSKWLGTDTNHSYKLVKETKDELGFKHSVYEHYYKGVKVMDDMILLHEKGGKVTYVNGEIVTEINLAANKQLTSQRVKNIIKADLKPEGKTKFSPIEEVIAKVSKGKRVVLYHTSKVEVLSVKPLQAFTYYIDNASGTIAQKISKMHDVDTPSVSSTYYKGDQSITVDSYNGEFRLKDNARNIHTMNGSNIDFDTISGTAINVTEYINPVANYTAANTKPPVEVHWAMKTAYDYYMARHNRNSYDGNGSKIDNYYGVNFGGSGGLNAAALDAYGIVCMLYGDGTLASFSLMNPVVGIDVAGHEYSHLIIGRNGLGGLKYQGESGALNESIADMMGTAIEFYSGITPNWTIGEGIVKPNFLDPSPSPFLRSMSNPNSANSALFGGPQPDTYQGTYWADPTNLTVDAGGVHTNSGVSNYWFYLLSTGGSGTNDIGNNFNVSGITIEKAEKIIYRTLLNYLTPNATFMDAYTATQQAVTDLYGASGNEQLQNIKAWYAVGIGYGVLATKESAIAENQFRVYPNPVKNGIFTIESTKDNIAVDIYDASGRVVKSNQKLNKGVNTIYLNNVQKGIYVLKITSDDKTLISNKKIIVE